MIEDPDWGEIAARMKFLTLRELKPIIRHFGCSLGGASNKGEKITAMLDQMYHWWWFCDESGRKKVEEVLEELEHIESFYE